MAGSKYQNQNEKRITALLVSDFIFHLSVLHYAREWGIRLYLWPKFLAEIIMMKNTFSISFYLFGRIQLLEGIRA